MAKKPNRTVDPRAKIRGATLRQSRISKQLSQGSVADSLGCSREAVSQWESGKTQEIERGYRLGLCKLLGIEERDLLLDPDALPTEFEMPLSQDAKSIAYRWDDLPEPIRAHLKQQIVEVERLMRETPDLAKRLYPQLEPPPRRLKKPK